jgi:altronate dehydratase
MYRRMSTDMDVNAGEVIDGTASLTEVGRQFLTKSWRRIWQVDQGRRERSPRVYHLVRRRHFA